MTWNVCICGRVIEHGARECDECAAQRIYEDFKSGKIEVQYGDDPLHESFDASQSSPNTEPIRQPTHKHTRWQRSRKGKNNA